MNIASLRTHRNAVSFLSKQVHHHSVTGQTKRRLLRAKAIQQSFYFSFNILQRRAADRWMNGWMADRSIDWSLQFTGQTPLSCVHWTHFICRNQCPSASQCAQWRRKATTTTTNIFISETITHSPPLSCLVGGTSVVAAAASRVWHRI